MSDVSKLQNDLGNTHSSYERRRPFCSVCDGKKYNMVATKGAGNMTTVYERQACEACIGDNSFSADEKSNDPSRSGRKRMSGTGYLRNKKRRRKDDD